MVSQLPVRFVTTGKSWLNGSSGAGFGRWIAEGSDEFRHRVVTVVEGILALHPGVHLAIVCHGGVINAYLGHILGLNEDMFFRPAHASVSQVRARDERRVIHTLNEFHHLAAVDPALVTF